MKFKTVVPILMVLLSLALVACRGKEKSVDNFSDNEAEEMYGDSPVPDWSFEILTTEDKPANGEEAYLYAGGLKYKGFTIKAPGGYAEYSNRDDYQSLVVLFYMVDHLANEYSKSGDTYPSQEEWTKFQTEILDPLREGAWNWEAITVKKWKKKAGDLYYQLNNTPIMIGDRGADWQSYFYELNYGSSDWKKHLVISAAKGNNEFKLPEDALMIRTSLW